jgi:hypothetical protein
MNKRLLQLFAISMLFVSLVRADEENNQSNNNEQKQEQMQKNEKESGNLVTNYIKYCVLPMAVLGAVSFTIYAINHPTDMNPIESLFAGFLFMGYQTLTAPYELLKLAIISPSMPRIDIYNDPKISSMPIKDFMEKYGRFS